MRVKFLRNIGFTDSKGYHLCRTGKETSIMDARAEYFASCGYVKILGPDEPEIDAVEITASGEKPYDIHRMQLRKLNVKKSKKNQ